MKPSNSKCLTNTTPNQMNIVVNQKNGIIKKINIQSLLTENAAFFQLTTNACNAGEEYVRPYHVCSLLQLF